MTTAIASMLPILSENSVMIRDSKQYVSSGMKNPQVVDIEFGSSFFRLVNSHWRSQKGGKGGDKRLKLAQEVAASAESWRREHPQIDIVIVGDFNLSLSDYIPEKSREHEVASVLKISKKEPVDGRRSDGFYNSWFELDRERYSSEYNYYGGALDTILLSSSMYDGNAISYIDDSFMPIGSKTHHIARYILRDKLGLPYRWQVESYKEVSEGSKTKTKYHHHGLGYSDHLPVSIKITTASIGGGYGEADLVNEPYRELYKISRSACSKYLDIDKISLDAYRWVGACVQLENLQVKQVANMPLQRAIQIGGKEFVVKIVGREAFSDDVKRMRVAISHTEQNTIKKVRGMLMMMKGPTLLITDENDLELEIPQVKCASTEIMDIARLRELIRSPKDYYSCAGFHGKLKITGFTKFNDDNGLTGIKTTVAGENKYMPVVMDHKAFLKLFFNGIAKSESDAKAALAGREFVMALNGVVYPFSGGKPRYSIAIHDGMGNIKVDSASGSGAN